MRGKGAFVNEATTPGTCQVRSKTETPCRHRAVVEIRGIPFDPGYTLLWSVRPRAGSVLCHRRAYAGDAGSAQESACRGAEAEANGTRRWHWRRCRRDAPKAPCVDETKRLALYAKLEARSATMHARGRGG